MTLVVERCNPPVCVRVLGHGGACRPSWHRRPECGVLLRNIKEPCARRPGHTLNGGGHGHRSRLALDSQRDQRLLAYRGSL